MQDHESLVRNLKKNPIQILTELTPESADLIHMIMGVVGEAGELLDAIKKHTMYNKPLDLDNVIEELGDIEFYLEGIRQTLNLNRIDILNTNINKLTKRYSSGTFTNEQAQQRADKQ